MTSRNYPQLGIEEFGEQLLRTGDLDPLYIALFVMNLPSEQLGKFLVSYTSFYSAGVACHMSEQTDRGFWEQMEVAAKNEVPAPHGGRWERGKERRHARGAQGLKMVTELRKRYPRPAAMVDYLTEPSSEEGDPDSENPCCQVTGERQLVFSDVVAKVKEHYLSGDWIAYKYLDLIDRVCGIPVTLTLDDAMYEEPRKAALMIFDAVASSMKADWAVAESEDKKVHATVEYLLSAFRRFKAPPRYDRSVSYQEIETILCKFKSHVGGHYPLLNDIHEIRAGVEPWAAHSGTARRFLEAMPTGEEIRS